MPPKAAVPQGQIEGTPLIYTAITSAEDTSIEEASEGLVNWYRQVI